MEDKKYYTPEPEEFHIGFHFEYKYSVANPGDKGWTKKIFTGDNFEISDATEVSDFTRVKYLDHEDIESLGFIQESQATYFKDGWYIEWLPTDTLDVYCASDCRFKGIIKNKAELKKLLTQLGI
jgi:hypothetical protein